VIRWLCSETTAMIGWPAGRDSTDSIVRSPRRAAAGLATAVSATRTAMAWTDRSLARWRFEFTEQDLADRGCASRFHKAIR
jgi:hypothetical protein